MSRFHPVFRGMESSLDDLVHAFLKAAYGPAPQQDLADCHRQLTAIPEPLVEYHIDNLKRLRESILSPRDPVLLASIIDDIEAWEAGGILDLKQKRGFGGKIGKLIAAAYDIPSPYVSDEEPVKGAGADFCGNSDLSGTVRYASSALSGRWEDIAETTCHEVAGHGAEYVLAKRSCKAWFNLSAGLKEKYPALQTNRRLGKAGVLLACNNPWGLDVGVYFQPEDDAELYRAQLCEKIAFWLDGQQAPEYLVKPLRRLMIAGKGRTPAQTMDPGKLKYYVRNLIDALSGPLMRATTREGAENLLLPLKDSLEYLNNVRYQISFDKISVDEHVIRSIHDCAVSSEKAYDALKEVWEPYPGVNNFDDEQERIARVVDSLEDLVIFPEEYKAAAATIRRYRRHAGNESRMSLVA